MLKCFWQRCEIVPSRRSRTNYAHQLCATQQVVESKGFSVWRGALKIRVSVVRFRPWPPPFETVVLLVETAVFSLCGCRFERRLRCSHFAATLPGFTQ
jgi:hypothetical protein